MINLDELEKLARAGKDNRTDFSFMKDFKEAANPAAILELIENYREVVRCLTALTGWAEQEVGADLELTPGLADGIIALARANGESNE